MNSAIKKKTAERNWDNMTKAIEESNKALEEHGESSSEYEAAIDTIA